MLFAFTVLFRVSFALLRHGVDEMGSEFFVYPGEEFIFDAFLLQQTGLKKFLAEYAAIMPDLSLHGNSNIYTPNLDRFATEGVHFRNAFVTTSLCSPSRASILTGQYMHNHGVVDNNRPPAPGAIFFPQYLRQAGYETAFVGKWHMGEGASGERRTEYSERALQ